MKISIVSIVIEVDGQLCHANIPKGTEQLILSVLRANEGGKIEAVKLPPDWKKVTLSEAIKP